MKHIMAGIFVGGIAFAIGMVAYCLILLLSTFMEGETAVIIVGLSVAVATFGMLFDAITEKEE